MAEENSVPKWLNESFLEKHLQNYYSNPKITVQNFRAKSATAKGENYTSIIYRVHTEFTEPSNEDVETRSLSIIIKAPLGIGYAYESLISLNAYNKEMEFYGKIAPKIDSVLREIGDSGQLLPKVYGVCAENSAILLEDMAASDYGVITIKQGGYSFDDAKFITKRIALFHAACAVLQEKYPNLFKNFTSGFFTRENLRFTTFYETQFDAVLEVISKWPDFTHYAEKMRSLRCKLIEKIHKTFDTEPHHFNTFVHLDIWNMNLLLKLANVNGAKRIENAVLIDLTFSYWTAPATDLHYFFNTSLNEELRPAKFDELVAVYHEHLEIYLKQMNFKQTIPTLKEFQQQFVDKVFYGFVAAVIVQPISLNEHTEDACYESLALDDERALAFKRLIYSAAKVHSNLRKLIPYFDQYGIFD